MEIKHVPIDIVLFSLIYFPSFFTTSKIFFSFFLFVLFFEKLGTTFQFQFVRCIFGHKYIKNQLFQNIHLHNKFLLFESILLEQMFTLTRPVLQSLDRVT